MGSPCEAQLFAPTSQQAEAAAAAIIQDVERLESRYSRYRDDSVLSGINRVAETGGAVTVDNETAGLLDYAVTCYQQSDGLFDITSGILRRAWRFGNATLPSQADIATLLARVGWHRLRWAAPVLEFTTPGMELDLGGIVKEYAADRAATLCKQSGIERAVVNLGGDIRVVGPRADGTAWRIGVQHPRRHHAVVETLILKTGAVASSGDYQRCIIVEGVRYGHVLNPRTGWPVRHLAAVTVVGDLCVVAGSASTIAMLKEEQGAAWLAQLGLPHLWVDTRGQCGGSLLSSR